MNSRRIDGSRSAPCRAGQAERWPEGQKGVLSTLIWPKVPCIPHPLHHIIPHNANLLPDPDELNSSFYYPLNICVILQFALYIHLSLYCAFRSTHTLRGQASVMWTLTMTVIIPACLVFSCLVLSLWCTWVGCKWHYSSSLPSSTLSWGMWSICMSSARE